MNALEIWVRRSYPLTIVAYTLHELLCRWRLWTGNIDTDAGTAHSHRDLSVSIDYVRYVFEYYRRYADVDRFSGRVAEVGPGDSCGVALLLRVNGAETVDLLDRFHSRRDPAYQAQIYSMLIAEHPQLRDIVIASPPTDEGAFEGIERFEGPKAAAEIFFETNKGYDFILSCAVLEHIYDPESALLNMVDGLNPGGRLIHMVDLRDHGMFSIFHHELKFLEVPDVIYPHMTKAAGRPNRFLIDRYRTVLNNLPVSYELRISWLAGVGEMETYTRYEELPQEQRNASLNYVRGVRHRFARSLSSVSDEDLSVAAFVMIATRNEKTQ